MKMCKVQVAKEILEKMLILPAGARILEIAPENERGVLTFTIEGVGPDGKPGETIPEVMPEFTRVSPVEITANWMELG